MKLGPLNLSLYIAAFVAQTAVAHAEFVGVSQSQPAPAAPVTQQAPPAPAAPTSIVPPTVGEGEGKGIDPRIGKFHADGKTEVGGTAELTNLLKNFDLVVVIDKATQREVAYRNSTQDPNHVVPVAALQGKISTGTETRECQFVQSKTPNADGLYPYTVAKSIFRDTPTGYYNVFKIEASHYSSEYDAAPMPNAVGFLASEGIWNHSKTPSEEPLGQVASHGCVRMSFRDSRDLFTMVAMTGSSFNPTDDAFRAHCAKMPGVTTPCSPSPDEDRELFTYFNKIKQGNYPLSIDKKNPANSHDLKSNMPRLSPRSASDAPILLYNKNGSLQIDPQTGQPKTTTNGYNTLYIVKDSRLGTDKEKPVPPPKYCRSLAEVNRRLAAGDPDPTGEGRGTTAPETTAPQQVGQPFNLLNPWAPGGLFNRNPQPQPQQQQPRRTGNR